MLWLFVILGLVAFSSAGLGFLATLRTRSVQSGLHFAALFLSGAAWVAGHEHVTGWMALFAAMLVEIGAWGLVIWKTDAQSPASPDEPVEEVAVPDVMSAAPRADDPVQWEEPGRIAQVVEAHPPAPRPAQELRTMALLRNPWHLTAEVFLASLRRGGQRDARLRPRAAGEPAIHVETAGVQLGLNYAGSAVAADIIDYAVAQSFRWPAASQQAALHRSHIVLTTRASANTRRADVVRVHLWAHAALAEFAPLCAVLWPDAGLLVSPTEPPAQAAGDLDIAGTCVTFRTFPLDDAEAGRTLCDTAGLHAFGLPDIQLVTVGEPDETASRVLYQLANELFSEGCRYGEADLVSALGSEKWVVAFTDARFPPARRVIALSRIEA